MRDAPIVLLGRGGSGTRLLSELGRAFDIFLGNTLNVSGDSVEWVDTIYPLAIESVTAGIAAGSARDAYWRDALARRAEEILGAERQPAERWGWKLPETIVAVPQVLRTFARARIVHLVRHPVTSALRRTHVTSRNDNPIGDAVLRASYREAHADPAGIEHDPDYLRNALTWEFQVRHALDALERAPAVPLLQLRYEDVCRDPQRELGRLAAFLDRAPRPDFVLPAIDAQRTNPVCAHDPRAERVWTICGRTAERLGYARLA